MDAFLSGFARHVRRYRPFYVFAAAWIAMVAILPTPPLVRQLTDQASVPLGVATEENTAGGSTPERGTASGTVRCSSSSTT